MQVVMYYTPNFAVDICGLEVKLDRLHQGLESTPKMVLISPVPSDDVLCWNVGWDNLVVLTSHSFINHQIFYGAIKVR